MGLLDGLLGNASQIDSEDVQQELQPILADEENVVFAVKEIRDMYVFTNYRLILIDKQGVTGRKVEYHSVPYRAITHFKLETAGHFDLDAELKIWISGSSEPIERELKSGDTTLGIQKALANFAIKK
ncbi:PH domain-containing protein [Catenovulum agarivorans]|uniref:PH domain-containing protein n=1 Tax=Catenovulum agarivorans TaxID=1172192 RepID=UPI00031FA1FE|nr:PH domain-containing protein [Catenovulum agarivorans]